MDITQKIGIAIFSGVPAIIGGGIVYALSHGAFVSVIVYEVVLMLVVAGILIRK